VIYDDTPVELHKTDILDRLQREGSLTFEKIFEGRAERSEVIGLFLALLHLMSDRKIVVAQDGMYGRIDVSLRSADQQTDATEETEDD
jgi:chromatin segregation and condensation protein Rec8/ScpA/Scc1 (kleisin family)